MEALEAIRLRSSIRQYDERPVDRSLMEKVVEAGRVAPTARGEYPWEFIVVTEKEALKRMADITDHGKFIADCSFCVATFCRDTKYYLEDGCAATENMLIAATALGIGSCWVAGDKKAYVPEMAKLLRAPAGHKLVSMVAFGYPKREISPHAKRPLKEVLHWERY